jgi:hypothetical protein
VPTKAKRLLPFEEDWAMRQRIKTLAPNMVHLLTKILDSGQLQRIGCEGFVEQIEDILNEVEGRPNDS